MIDPEISTTKEFSVSNLACQKYETDFESVPLADFYSSGITLSVYEFYNDWG